MFWALFVVFLILFVFVGARGPEKKVKMTKTIRNSSPNTPKSTENDPLGLLKGPIGASLRFIQYRK